MKDTIKQLLNNIRFNEREREGNLVQLGLIIEKNTIKYRNNNGFVNLLKPEYFEVKLDENEINEILDLLIKFINESDSCICTVIWIFGKSCNKVFLETLFQIVLDKYSDNTYAMRQLMFSIDTLDKELIKKNLKTILDVKTKTTDERLKEIINDMVFRSEM